MAIPASEFELRRSYRHAAQAEALVSSLGIPPQQLPAIEHSAPRLSLALDEYQHTGDVLAIDDGWARICLRHQTLTLTHHSPAAARADACVCCEAEIDALRARSRFAALHDRLATALERMP